MEKQRKLLTLGAGMASMAAIVGGSVFMSQGSSSASAAAPAVNGIHSMTGMVANQAAVPTEQAAYITALATKLGISETKLTDALKAVQLDRIAQAVKDGKLTQAQADAMTTRINSGTAPMFGFGGPGHDGGKRDGGKGEGRGVKGMDEAALATFLGIDEPTLETALHSGKSLATVATDNGKSRDQLKTFLTTQLTTALNNAVTAGKMTQAQADARLATAKSTLDVRIDKVEAAETPDANEGPETADSPSTTPSIGG